MTAPIYFEPRDPADLPLIAVPQDYYDAITRTPGSIEEIDGDVPVVTLHGYAYVVVSFEVAS